jgi:uncharacterized protein (TIGR02001 family)
MTARVTPPWSSPRRAGRSTPAPASCAPPAAATRPARQDPSPHSAAAESRERRLAFLGGLLLIQLGLASTLAAGPASAQLAATLSAETDDRYRGESVSDGRPAFDLAISLDTPSGFYGEATTTGSPQPGAGLRLIGLEEGFGYARRLASGVVVDVGFADYQRWRYQTDDRYGFLDTEVYAGVRRGDVSAYLFYSPHYYADGARALYAEVEAQRTLWGPWRVFGHAGVLTPLGAPASPYGPTGEQPDGSLGVSRSFHTAKAFLAWSIASRQPYAPAFGPAGQAVIFGVAWGF